MDDEKKQNNHLSEWLPPITWGIAAAMVIFVCFLYFFPPSRLQAAAIQDAGLALESMPTQTLQPNLNLPEIDTPAEQQGVGRVPDFETIQSARSRTNPIGYVVEPFDSIFGIANKFNISPETVMWANYDVLNDNPDMLSVGQELIIPPVNGVLYIWQEGDTFKGVAAKYFVTEEEILLFTGNNFDLTNPEVEPGQMIMIPGGYREFVQWIVPTIPSGKAGVSTSILGPGGCTLNSWPGYGSGTFVYPTASRRLSGNDYWSGHLAIDLAVGIGDPVFASDGGTVVYAGWNASGYGYMVMIDHGNGYQTLYAHLSRVSVSCGSGVYQGQTIGYGGSTGNSTGAHLHFEVRFMGGFLNPWNVLP
ncbi:MAG TPA: M23 family metallopeptidase [Chloroflexi bacterium]|nr:M23 family metallopeptidase [Chloroflexota bacterium]